MAPADQCQALGHGSMETFPVLVFSRFSLPLLNGIEFYLVFFCFCFFLKKNGNVPSGRSNNEEDSSLLE